MSGNLPTLPEELLVQHILARLDLPTLRSCTSTCKRLNLTVKSSALLNYLTKLQEMNLSDNPAVSFNEISLARRSEMLRQYEEGPRIRWKASATLLPRQHSLPFSIKGEANVICIPPSSVIDTQELYWTTLPSKENQEIERHVFRPSNPSVSIAAHALSIEENDLFAFATWEEDDLFPIQIHLMQHSTRLPFPGLASPVMDIGMFESLMGDQPVVKLAICGTNLAVMVGHESLQGFMDRSPDSWMGHLSVWNWKTGEKRGEKEGIPDKDMGMMFLNEDILLHASSMGASVNIYHIPPSDPSARGYDLPLVECLGLPRPKDEFFDLFPEFNLDISFAENPTAVPSFAETLNPIVPRLFTPNNFSSILTIKMMFEEAENCTSYLFVTHYQALLDRAERSLSHSGRGQDVTIPVRWEKWGPDVTRMFWHSHHLYRPPFDSPCGFRLFVRGRSDNLIEVYDFGRAANRLIQNAEEIQIGSGNTLHWIVDRGGHEYQGEWFQGIVQTHLPFVRHTLGGPIDGGWDTMYVDQSRIVGIKDNERIDVLYIG